MHPTFFEQADERTFRSQGFVQVDLLPRSDALALREEVLSRFYREGGEGCSSSTDSLDVELRRSLHELIVATMGEAALDHLVDHQPFTSSVVVKWPGDDSAMPGHRDWTFVDEEHFRSLSFWMPLQDVDESNGALWLVPGSHRPPTSIRTNPGRSDGGEAESAAPRRPVPLSAGAGVAFDHATFHESLPNRSEGPRLALVLALAPAAASFRHFWRRSDGTIERYEIRDVDFFRRCRHSVAPSGPGVRLIGEVAEASA